MGAGVGYKRFSPTLCHSPPTPASRFNLIGRARERPGETHSGGVGGEDASGLYQFFIAPAATVHGCFVWKRFRESRGYHARIR